MQGFRISWLLSLVVFEADRAFASMHFMRVGICSPPHSSSPTLLFMTAYAAMMAGTVLQAGVELDLAVRAGTPEYILLV